MGFKLLSLTLLLVILCHLVLCENKYSKKANEKKETAEEEIDFKRLNKPFRMAKLNMLWSKARLRLTDPKLKSLFSDLRIHDKEELTHKRLKSDGNDKEGLYEAKLRKKLIGIMSTYGLLEHFEDVHDKQKLSEHEAFNGAVDDYLNKSLFRDKKLNKLWLKAEMSGFTAEELQALKEEFTHHQEKVDQYYSILDDLDKSKQRLDQNAVDSEDRDRFNMIENEIEDNNIEKDPIHHANLLREKHRDLKSGYDRLHRLAARGPNNKEFIEPKVQGLWKIAIEADFKPDELESLRVELKHYEERVLKLRGLQAEHVSNLDKHARKVAKTGDKHEKFTEMEDIIKKQARKVEKLHMELENKILERHSEL